MESATGDSYEDARLVDKTASSMYAALKQPNLAWLLITQSAETNTYTKAKD